MSVAILYLFSLFILYTWKRMPLYVNSMRTP